MASVDAKFDLETIMGKDVALLNAEELRFRLKELDKKIAVLSKNAEPQLSLLPIGPDDKVEITMCTGPMGDLFKINEKAYGPGKHVVTKRLADQLAYMVSEAYKIERERLMNRGNVMEGALLRGEQLAKIERYQQIMKED